MDIGIMTWEYKIRQLDLLLAGLVDICTKNKTDITLLCGKETFHCHKLILEARSTAFCELLHLDAKVLQIERMEEDTMDRIINYIYTNNIYITEENLISITKAAARFHLELLLRQCFNFYINQFNNWNLDLDILIMAQREQLEDFKVVAIMKLDKKRKILIKNTAFRNILLAHPDIMLLLYKKICEDLPEEMSNTLVSHGHKSSSNDVAASIWTCYCGLAVTGQYCNWCGDNSPL